MELKFSKGLFTVQKNGKWGFKDGQGNVVIPCKYDSVNSFSSDLTKVEKNGKYGLIDIRGNEVLPCKYCYHIYESEGLFNVEKNFKYGVVDKQGNEVIPCGKYDYVGLFNEGLCIVNKRINYETKYGVVNKLGKEIVPCKYDIGSDYGYKKGFWIVAQNDKKGVVDKQGKEIVPCKYDVIGSEDRYEDKYKYVVDGFWRVKKNRKWGLIDTRGNEVLPCKYADVSISDGFFIIKEDEKYGIIDKQGSEVLPCKYADVSISDGFFKVKEDEKYGIIDKQGSEVIPCVLKCDNNPPGIIGYCEGKYSFMIRESAKGLRVGLINALGEEILPCEYLDVPELVSSSLRGSSSKDSGDISSYCHNKTDILFKTDKDKSIVSSRHYLVESDLLKCFIQLLATEEKLTIELVLKNYGKKKEDVEPNGTITFSNATDNLTYNYTGGAVTFIPSSRQWVSTSIIRISDEDMVKILHGEKTTVTTQQGETLPVKEAYEDYLCLKYLVCPLACTDEQKAYLQNMVDKEKQEAQRKAAELEVKHQEEKRAERAANERKLQEQNSGCASVIIVLLIVAFFLL